MTIRILSSYLVLFLLLSPLGTYASQDGLTLDDCVKMALERNEKVIGAQYGVNAAEGQLTEASANFWPVLDYQYRAAPVPTDVSRAVDSFFEGQVAMFNSLHVGVGIPLTAFGQIKTAKDLARHGIEAAKLGVTKEKGVLASQVTILYYGIQLAAEIDGLLRDALEKINRRIETEEAKDLPALSPIEMVKLKLFRAELMTRRAEILYNRRVAEEGLRIQLALPDDRQLHLSSYRLLSTSEPLRTPEELLAIAAEKRPEARLSDVGVAAKSKQFELEKLKLRPRAGVGLFADVGRTTSSVSGLTATDDFSDPFNFTRAGVGFQLEGKIDFHGAAGRIDKAKAEYLKASYERNIAKRGLGLEVRKAHEQARRAQENMSRAEEAEKLARQMLFLAKSNMEIGVDGKDDYAEALKNVLLTRGLHFQSIFDYNVAMAELTRVTGESNDAPKE
ncbi:MAG: TolC family protein [Deltaproteobacteria bacterium]|nr:TolC family protein [Deltaproteobacteria bacterium]